MSTAQHKYKIGVRRFGAINWIGFYTLYLKEVQRFFNVWLQTIVSPLVTLLLFLAVFSLAIGSDRSEVLGYSKDYAHSAAKTVVRHGHMVASAHCGPCAPACARSAENSM